jgi:hypothetical protein
LLFRGYIERPRSKTAVVKTYPVPLARFASLDSPGHVFAADPAKEGRQDAQLLERRREPARPGRPGGAAHVLYLGEIRPSQAAAWRKSIEVFDEDAGHSRTLALFPEDRCAGLTPDSSIVQLRLSEMRLCRSRQWGACWLAGQVWGELVTAGSLLGRSPACEPQGDAVGSGLAGPGDVPADRAGAVSGLPTSGQGKVWRRGNPAGSELMML